MRLKCKPQNVPSEDAGVNGLDFRVNLETKYCKGQKRRDDSTEEVYDVVIDDGEDESEEITFPERDTPEWELFEATRKLLEADLGVNG